MLSHFLANQRTASQQVREKKMSAPMIQYVVVRGDLLKVLKWPVGALIAQACHACSAVIHLFHEDPNTVEYTKDLDRMHKVILEVRNPAQKFLKKSLIFHPLDSDYVLIFC